MTQIDDEVREKLARELHWHDWDCEVSMAYNYGTSGLWDEQDKVVHEFYFKQSDQILTLIQPLIKQAKQEERKWWDTRLTNIIKALGIRLYLHKSEVKKVIDEARRSELKSRYMDDKKEITK